jgi:hypothetical protein
VIELTLIDDRGSVRVARTAPFFRITGGNVWTSPGDGRIVRFTPSGWEFEGQVWEGMRFEGPSRLIMGLHKEPTSLSEVLQSVSITREVLSANGIPFAAYDPDRDMWRSAVAQIWWHAFRLESVGNHPSVADSTGHSHVGPSRDPTQDTRPHGLMN